MQQRSDHTIDLGGTPTPFSLLKISQIFRGMRVGDTLEIQGCDADTRTDLLKILPPSSYQLLHEEGETYYRILLRKNSEI